MKQQKFDCDGKCLEEHLNYSRWFHISKKGIDFEDCKKCIVKLISINKMARKNTGLQEQGGKKKTWRKTF